MSKLNEARAMYNESLQRLGDTRSRIAVMVLLRWEASKYWTGEEHTLAFAEGAMYRVLKRLSYLQEKREYNPNEAKLPIDPQYTDDVLEAWMDGYEKMDDLCNGGDLNKSSAGDVT